MFIDHVKIHVRSGKGGDGVVHFRREKYVPRGGPDGGDGGKGGNVILEVAPVLNTLSNFQHKTKYFAQDGLNGAKQNMTGHSGEDLVIQVPPGTMVYAISNDEILGDLTEPGQRIVVAKGGRGGRGNARFATSVRQVPRMAEKGEPGEEFFLRLELKLIADIGIVGVPNAGKSTLLASITHARPKIAPYPFTTLEPNLGVANLAEDTSLILADIPGLIEGAHLGVGLGHEFLKHIQRTHLLVHLLDGLSENPVIDFAQINTELALFDPNLAEKPQLIACNKFDLPDVQARWPKIEAELKSRIKKDKLLKIDPQFFTISAVTGAHVRDLFFHASRLLKEIPPSSLPDELPIYRAKADPRQFTITKISEGWRVSGQAIERAAAMTYWEHFQSIRRFQRILETLGVEKALREAGVENGDTVVIGDYELEWQD
jgi:GTP-binding protein